MPVLRRNLIGNGLKVFMEMRDRGVSSWRFMGAAMMTLGWPEVRGTLNYLIRSSWLTLYKHDNISSLIVHIAGRMKLET